MLVPATHDQEDNMQGKRTRACDSRGRPVPGLYVRDGRYIAGGMADGRWTMHNLDADTLTEARRERDSWLAGLREGRIATPARATFGDVFADWQDARNLSKRTRGHEQHVASKRLASFLERPVQDVTPTEIAALLREQRERYAPYSCAQTYRLLSGTFAHAVRRGLLVRNPMDGLAPTERPQKRAKREIARLDAEPLGRLVQAAASGALAGRARARRLRGPQARRGARASLAGRRPRRWHSYRAPVAPAGRDRQADEDRGGGEDGSATARAAAAPRRLEAPCASVEA